MSGRHPLIEAAKYFEVGKVEALLAAGTDPNVADETDFTPLYAAAWMGDDEGTDQPTGRIIAALLRAGADPHARHADGWTPLHHAVEGDAQNATAVRLLLAAGADPDAGDDAGRTPVPRRAPEQIAAMLALSLGQAREVVRRIGGDDSCR